MTMKSPSVAQQIDNLRPTLGFAARMQGWFWLGAAVGVVVSMLLWNPVPLMFSIFLAVVGFAERRAGPQVVAAIAAYDSAAPARARASIAITCWDMDNHYHVNLQQDGQPDWTYEFVPQGWQPAAGDSVAWVWRLGSDNKPALAAVEEGIMIPRDVPTAVAPSTENAPHHGMH